ncbi:MAG: proline dehydrogenase family protein [Firmicutes bacterium]|nr:proline dehydrogenase family protein [Bacillota bacterium]
MLIRDLIFWLSTKKTVTEAIAKRGMRYGFARRFVAGERLEDALAAGRELARDGRRISLNHLGENVSTVREAEQARDSYIAMVHALEHERIDGNVSIKLTQLGLDLSPSLCLGWTDQIAAAAQDVGRTIEIDMEGSAYTDATLEIFEAVRKQRDNVALAIQAYLYRSERDIERLQPLRPKIRLVKGAYREPKQMAYQKKSDVDANYRRLLEKLLDGGFPVAIATHDPAMLEFARAQLRARQLGEDRYEFQMIYGVRRDLQAELRRQGYPLRIYVPFGTEWCPYFMRRLAERPANVWFVLRSLLAETTR